MVLSLVESEQGRQKPYFLNFLELSPQQEIALQADVEKSHGEVLVFIHHSYIPEFECDELGDPEARERQKHKFLEIMANSNLPVIIFEESWRWDQYARDETDKSLQQFGLVKYPYVIPTVPEDPQPDIGMLTEEESWDIINAKFKSVGVTAIKLIGRAYIPGLGGQWRDHGCVVTAADHLTDFSVRIMKEESNTLNF